MIDTEEKRVLENLRNNKMRISRTVEYGLTAAMFVAQNCEDGLVMAKKISEAYDIPTEYLLQVMRQLVKFGILTSKRGPKGGYNLARPAKEITMLEIIEALDGPVIVPMSLVEQTGGKPFAKNIERVFLNVREAKKVSLAKIKLADLAGKK
jgi:Rrf2 family protein